MKRSPASRASLLGVFVLYLFFVAACSPTSNPTVPAEAANSPQLPAQSPIPLAPTGPRQFLFSALHEDRTTIALADTDGNILKWYTDSSSGDTCPAFSPDGLQVAFCSDQAGKQQLFLMDGNGSNRRLLTDQIGTCGCSPDVILAWSPDGQWISLPVTGADQTHMTYDIFLVRADGKKVINLTSAPQRYGGLAWDSDSRSLLLTGEVNGVADIWRIDINSKKTTSLTGTPIMGAAYSWSTDGKKLLYFADSGGGNFDIFLLQNGSDQPVRLTDANGFDSYPRWFPDGQHILFVSTRDGDQEIYRMNADGSGQTNLTNNPGVLDIWPSLSPDGQYVIYLTSSNNNNQWDSWIMKADGSGKRKLTDIIGIPSRITWKP